jgi:hypothetical protein
MVKKLPDEEKMLQAQVRIPPDLQERIAEWRRAQRDLPGKAEAIRRLIERGLGKEARQ